MNVARDGQQRGNESTALEKLVPCSASRRGTFGIFARSAADWSSVMTTRMFGRPSLPAFAGRASAARGGGSIATAATTAVAQGLIVPTVHRVSHGVNKSVRLRLDGDAKSRDSPLETGE